VYEIQRGENYRRKMWMAGGVPLLWREAWELWKDRNRHQHNTVLGEIITQCVNSTVMAAYAQG